MFGRADKFVKINPDETKEERLERMIQEFLKGSKEKHLKIKNREQWIDEKAMKERQSAYKQGNKDK